MSPLPIILFVFPFFAALLCVGIGYFYRGASRWIMLSSLLANFVVAVLALFQVLEQGRLISHLGGWPPPLGIEWSLDRLGALMAVLISGIGLSVFLATATHLASELPARTTSFCACQLLLLSGLMGMIMTADLFNLFVHLEISSLSAYALVAAGGRSGPKAAIRYLVIGSLGASFYLLGVGFLYAATGSLNMEDVAQRFHSGPYVKLSLIGAAFILAGLGTKMGLFPLHVWMPSAYAQSSSIVAAFMAPLVTKVAAFCLLRVLFWVYGGPLLESQTLLLELLCWAGVGAILYGGVMAIVQDEIRSLLAYSSISQMGIVAVGLGLWTKSSMTGAMLHIANDALMKAVLFLAASLIATRFQIRRVEELAVLRSRAPWISLSVLIATLSLIGLPPLCGFFGKWYVLSGAIETENIVLAIAIVLGSLTSAAYGFRIIEQMYLKPVQSFPPGPEAPRGSLLVLGALSSLILLTGVLNERIVTMIIYPALPRGL